MPSLLGLLSCIMALIPLQVVAAGLRGDINNDGEVDISDVTELINGVLHGLLDPSHAAADVNGDGIVDITDVTLLINCVLTGEELPQIEPQYQVFTIGEVTFVMVPVEGGTFMMGGTAEQGSDPIDRERPVHQVTLSSYYISQTEVTQALWQEVMGSNPSYFVGDNHPVEQVSWEDCQAFIALLNDLTGRTFRLPSEAEWEYAARGGNESEGYKYSGSNDLSAVAWYSENDWWELMGSGTHGTHSVATRNPNELDLYDMSGNVHEWCQDWFDSYGPNDQIDPIGPESGTTRVYRGGSWYFDEWFCRVSFRNGVVPTYRSYGIGFRLAL